MNRTIRRRIAALCILISFIVIGISAGEIITGRGNVHAASAIFFGLASVAGGLAYLRSSGRRS